MIVAQQLKRVSGGRNLNAEIDAYVTMLNTILRSHPLIQHLLPIQTASQSHSDLFQKIACDGLLLGATISVLPSKNANEVLIAADLTGMNLPQPQQKLNRFQVWENHQLVLQACKQAGLKLVNVGAEDLAAGEQRRALILGLVKQILQLFPLRKLEALSPSDSDQQPYKLTRKFTANTAGNEIISVLNSHLKKHGFNSLLVVSLQELRDGRVFSALLSTIDGHPPNTQEDDDLTDFERVQITLTRMIAAGLDTYARAEDVLNANEVLLLDIAATLMSGFQQKELPVHQQQPDNNDSPAQTQTPTLLTLDVQESRVVTKLVDVEDPPQREAQPSTFWDWTLMFICGK
eukprot:TRINITY_DN80536_c0_g1_i1.p1 TRINITY_DN80536_c0_g1~~TRINITY_DN80536_c0_g1_i1.p1  ORF type:complete len:346 (+),score=58.60 TRINITY_DN80536_c0_g1_i1:66-1103(+)